jgi:hypothetical protein
MMNALKTLVELALWPLRLLWWAAKELLHLSPSPANDGELPNGKWVVEYVGTDGSRRYATLSMIQWLGSGKTRKDLDVVPGPLAMAHPFWTARTGLIILRGIPNYFDMYATLVPLVVAEAQYGKGEAIRA